MCEICYEQTIAIDHFTIQSDCFSATFAFAADDGCVIDSYANCSVCSIADHVVGQCIALIDICSIS